LLAVAAQTTLAAAVLAVCLRLLVLPSVRVQVTPQQLELVEIAFPIEATAHLFLALQLLGVVVQQPAAVPAEGRSLQAMVAPVEQARLVREIMVAQLDILVPQLQVVAVEKGLLGEKLMGTLPEAGALVQWHSPGLRTLVVGAVQPYIQTVKTAVPAAGVKANLRVIALTMAVMS
jgi:hypothetical protein